MSAFCEDLCRTDSALPSPSGDSPRAPPFPGWPIPPPPMGQLEGREGGHSPLFLFRLGQEKSGTPGVISISRNLLRVISIVGILLVVQLASLAGLLTG